jgi:hypothetical protein
LGADLLGEAFQWPLGSWNRYSPNLRRLRYNVSYPELTMIVPDNVTLVSWVDEGGIGEFLDTAWSKSMLAAATGDRTTRRLPSTFPMEPKVSRRI